MATSPQSVLFVDDDQSILKAIKRVLRKETFRLLTATGPGAGLALLAEEAVQVVVSDHRMTEMSGVEFLARVKELYPDVIRIILTGHSGLETITQAVNRGEIYRFLFKPWNDENLKLEIRQAFEQYELLRYNKELAAKVARQNERLQQSNEKLEQRVADRSADLELRNRALEVIRLMFDNVPAPVFAFSPEGQFLLMNRAARTIYWGACFLDKGDCLAAHFGEPVQARFTAAVEQGKQSIAFVRDPRGREYKLWVTPFPATVAQQGVMMTFLPENARTLFYEEG